MPPSDSWMARVGAMSEPNAKVSKPNEDVKPKTNFQVKSQEILLKIPAGQAAEIRISKTVATWVARPSISASTI
jgi:hypothetical protein